MSKKILIIDDDQDYRLALGELLKSESYEVSSAPGAEEGMALIEESPPDLIILDVMMDKIDDGFNLCYKLKHDERLKRIPVIILSSVTEVTGFKFSPETDGEYLQAELFMHKPVDVDELLKQIDILSEK